MKKGEMLSKMIVLATVGHAGQFDKGDNPYILHPLKVMYKLKSDDEELNCIAVGHDLVEDTDQTYEELRKSGMSERVIDGIKALTKVPGESYDDYKGRVFANVDAMKVKSEDLRTNADLRRLKGITQKDIDRAVKYQIFYYEIQERLGKNA